ncbi:GIY-YIG nuclease family protein [Candidatus Gracilibacteria bacterium]|nr:GIY-YIG nuclease family protein [Candidatus Gracilibacteria bacterium]
MYIVYILRSEKDNKRYIGMTQSLERRLKEHYNGQVKSTKNRRPLILFYTEKFSTKEEASLREEFFKTGKGREFLNSKEKGA